MSRASEKLLESNEIRALLAEMEVALAATQIGGNGTIAFEHAPRLASLVSADGDKSAFIQFLSNLGAALADSDQERCANGALLIAQYLLEAVSQSEQAQFGALWILDGMANRPTIRLAETRGLLPSDSGLSIRGTATLEMFRARLLSQIEFADGVTVYANRFQQDTWKALQSDQSISVSAPTSAGKSFIVKRWLMEQYAKRPIFNAAYVVPTRALIQEVDGHMRSLLREYKLLSRVRLSTIPELRFVSRGKSNLFVMTQERLHVLQNVAPDIDFDVLVVDEAQKIGDGPRGVLLEQVIESVAQRSTKVRRIFLSPSSDNPELLLRIGGEGGTRIQDGHATVRQNLFWVQENSLGRKRWDVNLVLQGVPKKVGEVVLGHAPTPDSKRLPYVAHALARGGSGNIVYVNGAAEAEKVAHLLSELVGPESVSVDEEIEALAEFVARAIHPRYALRRVLRHGVAFHYGNMPLLVRTEIERLFTNGKLKYLVCTSTLIEGVNMSCKNMFVRGPKKGRSNLMGPIDFWNLAGRAGRWGMEFAGNIYCIDANRAKLWMDGHPPIAREKFAIESTAKQALVDVERAIAYAVDAPTMKRRDRNANLEAAISYAFACISGTDGGTRLSRVVESAESRDKLREGLEALRAKIRIPNSVIERNPGINPLRMQQLLDYFVASDNPPEKFLPLQPGHTDAAKNLTAIFTRTSQYLGSDLGEGGRAFHLAILVTSWMRGHPIAQIISEQLKRTKSERDSEVAATIRGVLEEIEQKARYEAPKFLACYADVLAFFLKEKGHEELLTGLEGFNVWLELGVSQQTQVSLIAIGLSRTAAIALSEFIVEDNLDESQCMARLQELDLEALDVPKLVRREVHSLLTSV
jgi:hypothetical protein